MYLMKTQFIKFVEVDAQQEKKVLKILKLFEAKTKEYNAC